MFNDNIRQFGIRHILVGTVLVSIAMGLLATLSDLAVMLAVLILVAIAGGLSSSAMMFVSDLIDNRRIDDRRKLSRFFNFAGLVIILVTALTLFLLGVVFLLQLAIWFLEKSNEAFIFLSENIR